MDNTYFFPLVAALCAFSACKTLSQRVGAGRHVHSATDSILFISAFFFFTSFAFLPSFLANLPAGATVAYAVGGAVLNLGFQVSYTVALTAGPMGLTCLFAGLSMLIPVLGASVLLGESFGTFRMIGLALTLIALTLNTDFRRRESGTSRIWGVATLLTFLFNGFAYFWQKWFAVGPYGSDIAGYNFLSYFLAAILGLLLILVLGRRGIKPSARPGRGFFGWAALVGLFLGCFQWVFTYSQRVLEASLLLPVYNGLATVTMTVLGLLLFRERLTKRRFLSTLIGVTAIVLFSITG